MPLGAFAAVAAQVAVSVSVIHGHGCCHDLKLTNLLSMGDNIVRLGDLGTAGASISHNLGIGTRGHMAPEQCGGAPGSLRMAARVAWAELSEQLGVKHDYRPADVWALGVTWLSALLPDEQVVEVIIAACLACGG